MSPAILLFRLEREACNCVLPLPDKGPTTWPHCTACHGRLSLFSYLRLTAVPLRLRLWTGCRSRGDLNESYKRSLLRCISDSCASSEYSCVQTTELCAAWSWCSREESVLRFLRPGAARPDPSLGSFASVLLVHQVVNVAVQEKTTSPKDLFTFLHPRSRECNTFFFTPFLVGGRG